MKPGREIDALVAEKVMGWILKKRWPDLKLWETIEGEDRAADEATERYSVYESFRPSTDISDAWEVVEKLGFPEYPFALYKAYEKYDHNKKAFVNPGFECRLGCECGTIEYCECGHSAWAETAPLAICLAALKAVGVEVE